MAFLYLSQVLGRPVYTEQGERVARVKDLVARLEALNAKGEISLEAYPPISGLLVEIDKRRIFVPWDHVRSLGREGVYLSIPRFDLRAFERREGEVLLARDILDKQLIDIDGRRVIRANDLQLHSDGAVRVTGVDVSTGALLRRLTSGRLFPGPASGELPRAKASSKLKKRRLAPVSLIRWEDIEPLAADVPEVRLRLSHERLAQLHPVDIAHIADELSRAQSAEIIESLDDETAAEALQEMDEERQADIVEELDEERAADILEEMDPDEAADLLADLDELRAEELKRRMDREAAADVEELLAYPEDSAGGIMTSDFITVPPRLTVDETLTCMRRLDDPPEPIYYIFVIDDEAGTPWSDLTMDGAGRLLGIVSLQDLVLANADRRLEEIMIGDYVWVTTEDSADKAARLIAEYKIMALPVLDKHDRIVGIITVDDALEELVPEPWEPRLPHVFS